MYREMRRKDRAMDQDEAQKLLDEADFGFLGLAGTDGQPYVVPVNHAYVDGCIVFHCAKQGQKLDMIRANPLVSYAVCTQHDVQPRETTTKFRSAIAFGKAEIVEDLEEKKALFVAIMQRLAPGVPFTCGDSTVENTCCVRIKVDKVTGKKRE